MAEAFLNKLCGERFSAESAGVSPTALNPYVVKAMAEVGIDLSTHRSKNILEFQGNVFDYVVTVCDLARENCPFFPGKIEIIPQHLKEQRRKYCGKLEVNVTK